MCLSLFVITVQALTESTRRKLTPGGGVFYYEKLERKWYSAAGCVSPLALRDLVLRVGDQSGSEDEP